MIKIKFDMSLDIDDDEEFHTDCPYDKKCFGYIMKVGSEQCEDCEYHKNKISIDTIVECTGDKQHPKTKPNKTQLIKFKDLQLIKADQQLTGFTLGRTGGSIIELIESMGLLKKEWKVLKKDYNVESYMNEDDFKEIEEYWESKNEN